MTTVTKPTLTYFSVCGRAEVPRLMLEDAGVDYDYVPFTYATWPEVKQQLTAAGKLPFGQVPLYEEPEGLTLVQGAAIARYLARKLGYNGTNAHEEALIDQAYEGVLDALTAVAKVVFELPADQQAGPKEKLVKETLPAHLAQLEKLLERNGNNGFLVGSRLSYADLNLFVLILITTARVEGSSEAINAFPAVKKLFDGVAARDRIKAYLARDVYKRSA